MQCRDKFTVVTWPKFLPNNPKGANKHIFRPRNFGGRTTPSLAESSRKEAGKYFLTMFSFSWGSFDIKSTFGVVNLEFVIKYFLPKPLRND